VIAAALIAAALITAALITAALITAGLVAAAVVTAALVAAAVVTAGLLAGHLVPAAQRLVVTASIPAPPVATLGLARRSLARRSLARRSLTRLGVLTRALRRAARLLGFGLVSGSLLSCARLGRGLLRPAVRPVGHGCLVETELLPSSVRTDPAARAGAQA
jgi:hypothetical protein